MDITEYPRDISDPAWRRGSLLGALFVLGGIYIFAYILFVTQSQNFIVAKRNDRALNFSRNHAIELPAKLLFGVAENDTARLGGGWHLPEVNSVWSATTDAWIELVVRKQNSANLLIRLNTIAFVVKPHPRIKITVSVNEMPLGSWVRDTTNASEPLDVRVPRSLAGTNDFAIHLRIDHGDSPFRLKVGPDRRQLGVLLTSIELREAPDAPANTGPNPLWAPAERIVRRSIDSPFKELK